MHRSSFNSETKGFKVPFGLDRHITVRINYDLDHVDSSRDEEVFVSSPSLQLLLEMTYHESSLRLQLCSVTLLEEVVHSSGHHTNGELRVLD